MAPSATEPSGQAMDIDKEYPAAKIFTPREVGFQSVTQSRPDGYKKARSLGPGKAAIVIDNGIDPSLRQLQ